MSLAVCGVLLIALGQVKTVAGILPLLFGMALFAGTLYPANATSMAKICPPELQVKGFALNRLANNLGATIGPAVGGLLAVRSYGLLFWADGLTSLAAAAVFAVLWKGAREEREARGGAAVEAAAERGQGQGLAQEKRSAAANAPKGRSPWRDGPFMLMMIIFFVWSVVFIQVLTTFPIYMRNVYGLAENRIGQLYPVNTILIVLLEMILMEKIRKYPLTRMINLSFVLLGIGLGMMPLGRGFAYGALTVAVWTFGEMLSMPLVTALDLGEGRRLQPRAVHGPEQLLVLAGLHRRAGGRHGDLRWAGARRGMVHLRGDVRGHHGRLLGPPPGAVEASRLRWGQVYPLP